MGSEKETLIFSNLKEVKSYGDPYWWLALYKCDFCHQNWLIAQESRHNDIHCYKRLSKEITEEILNHNNWPPHFKKYEELLLLGKKMARNVSYVDPLSSKELFYTIVDLAKEHTNIKASYIMDLLNLNHETATILCKEIVQKEKVQIDFN